MYPNATNRESQRDGVSESQDLTPQEHAEAAAIEEAHAERRAQKDAVAARVTEQYLTSEHAGYDQPLEQVIGVFVSGRGGGYTDLRKLGIDFDRQGRVRLQAPDVKGIPGSYERPEVLKAFLIGFRDAKTPREQWTVIKSVCEYLGVESPPQLQEQATEAREPWMPLAWLRQYAPKTLSLAPFLLLLLDGGRKPTSPGETATFVRVEQAPEPSAPPEGLRVEAEPAVVVLTRGDTLGTAAERLLHDGGIANPSKAQVWDVIKVLAQDNDVDVPELGVHGSHDDAKLPIGFEVQVSGGRATVEAMHALGT